MARWKRREFSLSERLEEQKEKKIHFRRPEKKKLPMSRPLWWLILLLVIVFLLYLYLKKVGM